MFAEPVGVKDTAFQDNVSTLLGALVVQAYNEAGEPAPADLVQGHGFSISDLNREPNHAEMLKGSLGAGSIQELASAVEDPQMLIVFARGQENRRAYQTAKLVYLFLMHEATSPSEVREMQDCNTFH